MNEADFKDKIRELTIHIADMGKILPNQYSLCVSPTYKKLPLEARLRIDIARQDIDKPRTFYITARDTSEWLGVKAQCADLIAYNCAKLEQEYIRVELRIR